MPVSALDVGVVGAGTAGAAAALFLARAGHRVHIYEAVPDPSPVGAGIMLQPSGMGVLAELGLLGAVLDRGAHVQRLRCVTERRRTVIDLAYTDYHAGAFGLGLHRGVLFDTLLGTARTTERIEVRCGVRVETLTSVGRPALHDADGNRIAEHDLVVVADGARSQLRSDALARRAALYPWGALWTVVPDPERLFDGELFQVVSGTREMLGFLPSGLGPDVAQSTPLVSIFWSVHAGRVDAWRSAGLSAWKTRVCVLEPRAEGVLGAIEEREELLLARYHDVVLSRWDSPDGVVFLGDAAHATSPQLGQGANLALCDAAELARALDAETTLREALARYTSERRAHLGYYQWATRFLTPFFQSDAAPLGWLRDAFMGLACKLPFVREKMIRTMCGLERGVLFGDPLSLPRLPAYHRGE